ncbi:cas1 domain-containing protein 1-like [Plakobranchus ocellatus]|uniref:Cas1 domain-containing protein 1-like n=1 Tax=Plakobranchus ocellatus TaxID=259542 RepID=A0AAV3Z481_9GAST|nr:cas1 domain-containing protein 1-like [Plakobranchus ocellatus]
MREASTREESHGWLEGPQQTAPPVDQEPHIAPQHQVTHAQLTLFIAYLLLLCFWTFHFIVSLAGIDFFGEWKGQQRYRTEYAKNTDATVDKNNDVILNIHTREATSSGTNGEGGALTNNSKTAISDGEAVKNSAASAISLEVPNSQAGSVRHKSCSPPPVMLDKLLKSAVLFGSILFYFYLCDYLKIFPQGQRTYSRDLFLFLVFLLFLVACVYTVTSNDDKILSRNQTEECKGWMQVLFFWYHYFNAREWHNLIRVFISCYVWTTGFGEK